jgi:hypothetical protein
MAKVKYQLIKFSVPQAGAQVNINASSDKLYKRIAALFVSLPEDKAFAGSTMQLGVNDQEVFPEGFEVKMISCSESVAPNDRLYSADEEAAGSTIKGRYTDGGQALAYPYTGIIYLKLEEKIQQ